MRLTLRTLLSYLDDTLEPAEAKLIGEKVAESDIAPELIERIKTVTRRRGLAAPAVNGDGDDTASDPNTVAEYLDNALPSEQLAEVEQSALDSDAFLAEIAACHQILTLVLGEPAKVPPTARRRMYRIVKGRESIPFRKSIVANKAVGLADPTANEENTEADEALLLGMTSTKLLVPIASAVVLLVLLIAVIWMAIPAAKPVNSQGYVVLARTNRPEPTTKQIEPPPKVSIPGERLEVVPRLVESDGVGTKDSEPLLVEPRVVAVMKDAVPPRFVEPPKKIDTERRAIGKLESKDLLLQKPRDTETWERVAPGKELFSADTWMCLPGNHCDIQLEGGVRLTPWGSLPEYHKIPVLDIRESRVAVNVPPKGFDADFTLESGRVFIARAKTKENAAPPARVIVRFKKEIWTVTLLDPETEICVDLLGYYSEGVPFAKETRNDLAPTAEFYFAVLRGKAGLRVEFREFPILTAPTKVTWDSVKAVVSPPKKIEPADMEWWNKNIPAIEPAKQAQAAVNYFVARLSKPDATKIGLIFFSAMQDTREQTNRRAYAVHCLQALDEIGYLADAIADDFFVVREIGIRAVQHWTGQAADRDLKFYKMLMEQKSYSEPQARAVMQLLHPLSPQDAQNPEIAATLFDSLRHEKMAVRELALLHLNYIDPVGAKEIGFFDVAAPENVRDGFVQRWKTSWKKRLVEK